MLHIFIFNKSNMREARSTHSKGGDKLVRREGEGQVFVKMGIIFIDSVLIFGV